MIELRQVEKSYGARRVVDRLSLSVARGELLVLMGASGSGKSTTLRMINRLVDLDAGSILFDGRDIRSYRVEELRRRIGYAIQSTGLFPHWTVARNVATVPQLLGWPPARIRDRVDELLQLLGLAPAEFRDRFPRELSGGQLQRVGVARALAGDPPVLLMDEPFGALDPVVRQALQRELAHIHRASAKTIVLVTHDVDEALSLATRVVLLDGGRLVQQGTPAQMLGQPASAAVREFLGGADLGLKRLGLYTVGVRARPGSDAAGPPLASDMSLRAALGVFLERATDRLPVVDAGGRPLGALHLEDLLDDRAR
jgi:osmoprotectant transport system ATP-binding protein